MTCVHQQDQTINDDSTPVHVQTSIRPVVIASVGVPDSASSCILMLSQDLVSQSLPTHNTPAHPRPMAAPPQTALLTAKHDNIPLAPVKAAVPALVQDATKPPSAPSQVNVI